MEVSNKAPTVTDCIGVLGNAHNCVIDQILQTRINFLKSIKVHVGGTIQEWLIALFGFQPPESMVIRMLIFCPNNHFNWNQVTKSLDIVYLIHNKEKREGVKHYFS